MFEEKLNQLNMYENECSEAQKNANLYLCLTGHVWLWNFTQKPTINDAIIGEALKEV